MAVSIDQFWDVLAQSQLIDSARLSELQEEFASFGGAATQGNSATVAQWLVSQSLIEPYHSRILQEGTAGPFVFGDYVVRSPIKRFGEGRWFEAYHRSTRHPVEIQFLTGAPAQDQGLWQRVVSQASQLGSLDSPQLQQVHQPVDLGSYRLMVYGHQPGESLNERIASQGPLTLAEACQASWTLAHGLGEMHRRGIVHGGICGESIRFTADGNCQVLMDVSRLDTKLDLVQRPNDERWLPLADYLAPELGQPNEEVTTKSDVYALGVCFFQMLIGQPPFQGGNLLQKMQHHTASEFPSLAAGGLPANADRLLGYLVHKDPQKRYPHAGEIPDKLQLLVPHEQLHLPAVVPADSRETYLDAIRHASPSAVPEVSTQSPQGPVIEVQRSGRSNRPIIDTSDSTSCEKESDEPAGEMNARRSSRRRRRPSRPIEKNPLFWGSIAAAAVATVVAILLLAKPGGESNPEEDSGKVAETDEHNNRVVTTGTVPRPGGGGTVPRPGENGGDRPVVEDDGTLLWQSPTAGSPPSLNWLPPGAQLMVFARPAALVAEGGEDVLRALGPAFAKQQAAWESASGMKLADAKRIVMGLYDNEEGFPRPAFVVELPAPLEPAALLEQLGDPEPVQLDNGTYYRGATFCFAIPKTGEEAIFLMGHEDDVVEAMKFPGRAPPIHPAITPLFKLSDADRHLTVLFAPAFLNNNVFRDGRALSIGEPRRMRAILNWLLEEEINAGMISLHVDQQLYLETRFSGGLARDKSVLARGFREKMEEVPDKVFDYIVQLNPHRHWRSIAMKYPEMIRFLNQQTRIGVDGGVAIANAALPAIAAPNLLVGAELCLVAEPITQVGGGNPTAGENKFKSLDDVLAHTMSLEIPQQDLNLAVADIETEIKDTIGRVDFPFSIKIIGDDLKVEGITRNQAIRDFVIADKPFSEVLTGLVMKANPDPSVKDPSEPNQKLVWVVGPDPDAPQNEILLITTRAAALDPERKFQLPEVFK